MTGMTWLWLLGMTISAQADVSSIAGEWSVPSYTPSKTMAVYSIRPDGSTVTLLPRIPEDVPGHLAHGGKITESGDGFVFRSEFFKGFAANLESKNPALAKQFKALAENGAPFKVVGTGPERRMVWQLPEGVKEWFPDNAPLTPQEVAKLKQLNEDSRHSFESPVWTIREVKPCEDPATLGASKTRGTERFFTRFFKPGSTFRLKREGNKRQAIFSSQPDANVPYFASYVSQNVQVNWIDGKEIHQLQLVDLAANPAATGLHRFQTLVEDRCMEVIAGANERVPAAPAADTEGKPAT